MTPRAALVRHRWLFVAAAIAGLAYWLVGYAAIDRVASIVLKGAGVGLLAVWAGLNARDRDGWLIASVLALGALGDVLIELSLTAGASAFLVGHVVAIVLYLGRRRAAPTPSQIALAVVLLVAVPAIAFLLPADRGAAAGVGLYALGLGAMAASAWLSRFPRYRVGIGAVLFAISDLMIFARMGPLAGSMLPRLLVWPLYFAGQALIAWGVVTTLAKWRADDDLHHRL